MRLAYTLMLALALSGCATKGLYDWGGYSSTLYNTYKDPTAAAAGIQQLETHIGKLEQGKQKVPPGLYADLGMLQLQAGDKEHAQANFRKERDLWPESAGLMNALINNGTMPQAKEGKS
nr:DUF4810 domain-containing protein [uncultured Massilia sp.]